MRLTDEGTCRIVILKGLVTSAGGVNWIMAPPGSMQPLRMLQLLSVLCASIRLFCQNIMPIMNGTATMNISKPMITAVEFLAGWDMMLAKSFSLELVNENK